jgi:hypothetical protein
MRRWAGLVGVLVTLALVGDQAAAEVPAAEPAVAFVDAEPVVTSCSELAGTGLRIRVRNETALPQKVRSEIELVRKNGSPVRPKSVCGGLELVPKKRALPPGKGAALTLTGKNAVRKGSFSGTLAIYGSRGRVARTDLTISSKPASSAPALKLAATPIVSSLSKSILIDDKGPFWVPVEGSNAELPAAVKDEVGVKALTVGALTGPGDPVTVVYRGASEGLPPGASQLGLELEGDLSPGTYSGQADLNPEDPEKGTVTLEFKVSKEQWIAILALLAGIVIGVWLLRIAGRTVPRARLLGRAGALAERYEKARNKLLAAGGSGGWNQLGVKDLGTRKEDLEGEIRKETRWWKVLVKIDPALVAKFEKEIEALEGEVDLLRKVPEHAEGLESALQPGPYELPPLPDHAGAGKATVEQAAEKLLKKDPIPLAALKSRLDAMDAKARQVGTLRELERLLADQWRRALELEEDLGPQNVAELKGKLKECRKLLWEAADEEALKKVGEQMERALEEIVKLEAKANPAEQAILALTQNLQAAGGPEVTFVTAPMPAATMALGVGSPPAPTPPPASPAPSPSPEAPLLTDGGARKVLQRAFGLQLLAVLAAAAVALAAGLEVLYVGKTWGTTWDVLAAIVWGITAQAVATTLVTSLDNLGSLAALWRRP